MTKMSSEPPSGTVTFLFTDIEDSTRLWVEHPEAMAQVHALHDRILRAAAAANDGYVFRTAGDAFNVAFHNAQDALLAALFAQRALQDQQANAAVQVRVRMGLHTGSAAVVEDGSDYDGYVTLASVQRVMSVAHGGQVLISQPTADLLGDLPEGVSLRNLGEHQLKGLRAPLRLYQLLAPELQRDFPPIQSPGQFPNNLPIQLTSFIGREKEIREIESALAPGSAPAGRDETRLVTLTGSGGTGKTRLSQEVGAQLLTDFEHGVWLLELAPLSDEPQIIPALAKVLGLQEVPFEPLASAVEDYLREKKLLLILDNCEHLIAACARLADHLLHQCARLKILASSREALGIAGEMAYHTPSLPESDSTRLFVDRARAANSEFALTDSNASAVAQICQRLDGIPLAIELAAARTKLLSPQQIATRLDDMFRLLVGGSRTALPRQQTLRALIDWSYDLLSDKEKRLLQFASVFVGGWTLEALEFVADEPNTLELLEQLVNKSLVVTEQQEGGMRYFLLETIRQYAREKLFEAKQAAAARDRHFLHFKEMSKDRWDISYLAMEAETQKLKSLRVEVENLRAALQWGMQNDGQGALELAAGMAMILSMLGSQAEGINDIQAALEKVHALPPVQGDADRVRREILVHGFFSLGVLLQGTNEIEYSRRVLQEAVATARELGDRRLLGLGLEMYANASAMIRAEDALEAAQEGLDIFREIDFGPGMVMAFSNLARWATMRGNFQEAEKYVALAQAGLSVGAVSFQTGFLNLGMGIAARYQGRYELALSCFEEGLQVFRQVGHKGLANALTSEIAHTQRAMGNYAEAKKAYRDTIKVFHDYGNRPAVAHQLECFAMIAIVEEEPQRAARLFGAAETLREATGHKRTDEEEGEQAQFVSRLRTMLPEPEFRALWAGGRAMTMEQAIQLALE
jgi:predicted ATPase/class 3 adenylate cyclase